MTPRKNCASIFATDSVRHNAGLEEKVVVALDRHATYPYGKFRLHLLSLELFVCRRRWFRTLLLVIGRQRNVFRVVSCRLCFHFLVISGCRREWQSNVRLGRVPLELLEQNIKMTMQTHTATLWRLAWGHVEVCAATSSCILTFLISKQLKAALQFEYVTMGVAV